MTPKIRKFAGIEVKPELTRTNFFFLYLCTILGGMFIMLPSLVYPAFLVEIVKIDQTYTGTINAFLQALNQVSTLFLVAYIGLLSDKVGRKILALIGFLILGFFFYLLSWTGEISAWLQIPSEAAGKLCAVLSWVPDKAAVFAPFGSSLLVMYAIAFMIGLGLVVMFPQFTVMVADYTHPKDRGKGMAMNGVMVGTAAIISFALFAPLMSKIGVRNLIYMIVAITMTGAVFVGLFLKDLLSDNKPKKSRMLDIVPVARSCLPIKATYFCSFIIRADMAILSPFLMSWGVRHGTSIGLSATEATMKSSVPMIVLAGTSFLVFPVVGMLLDRIGRVPVIIAALFCGAAGMGLIALAPHPFHFLIYIGTSLLGAGMSGSIAGPNALASDAAPEGMLGAVLGGLNTMAPLGALIFLGIGGYLFDNFGPSWAFGVKALATLLLALWVFGKKSAIDKAMDDIRAKKAARAT